MLSATDLRSVLQTSKTLCYRSNLADDFFACQRYARSGGDSLSMSSSRLTHQQETELFQEALDRRLARPRPQGEPVIRFMDGGAALSAPEIRDHQMLVAEALSSQPGFRLVEPDDETGAGLSDRSRPRDARND